MSEAKALPPKVVTVKVKKKGAPAYMVSFGDMMTLILCFFILLVSMSKERSYGLMAKGVGSFVMSIQSMGLTGIMDAHEKQAVFDEMRRRFNLPPEDDPERRAEEAQAATQEVLRAEAVEALRPRPQRSLSRIAVFRPGSALLEPASREYLGTLAAVLRPGASETLLLEGHAFEDGRARRDLALRRARAVRDHLVEVHGFDPARVEVRAWFGELDLEESQGRAVDARLLLPAREAK